MSDDDKCHKCGRTEEDAEIETLPCCGKSICFDFCIHDTFLGTYEPTPCPNCGKLLFYFRDEHYKENEYLRMIELEDIPEEDLLILLGISKRILNADVFNRMPEDLNITQEKCDFLKKMIIQILDERT